MTTIVLWVDANIDNSENTEYVKELESIGSLRLKLFKNIEEAIEQLKYLEFQETKVIISGSFYSEFIKSFKENILKMYIAPKIIVFTKNKENFVKENKDYSSNENVFYTFGGIATSFNEIKEFLKEKKIKEIKKQYDDVQLTFERIDKKEKLVLPIFFKTLIDTISNDNMEKYTDELYETYSKERKDLKSLLGSIASMKNIPIEILSRYYSRLYTADSTFHRNINKDLGLNKKEIYLPFIKTLYEGVKFKSLPLSNDKVLYRGSKISNVEINDIKNYMKKKIEGLPSSIVFSKSFLSFSKEKNVAEKFLKDENKDKNLSKVLFILEKDDNCGYNLSTHGDIEKISFFPNEREVLFFPFSSFEIKSLEEKYIGKEKVYEIKLLYLGKYLKDIENDNKLINNEIWIPDSKFKKHLEDFGLIKKEKIKKINIKKVYNEFKKYENEINQRNINNNTTTNKINIITGEINIKHEDINKSIQIINSYENKKRMNNEADNSDDWKYGNEREIKDVEIKIDGKAIKFAYTYKFEKEGKYQIEYIFKNNLTKANYLFYGCNNLTNLDLSKFNTQNVTNMSNMFYGCDSLTNLNLSNFNTQNVTNMDNMFNDCKSLTNLNLSNFNTQNVTNMRSMFYNCNSLRNLDLTNFNTQNVTNMGFMFYDCISLKKENIISKNNKILNLFS